MMTVFLKSTVRPWPSVSRPSSRICSRTLNTSGWAFSISSNSMTAVGPAAHRLGELAALLVADVAGGRADQPGHGVLLHVLGHVDADHGVLVVEEELGQRAGELGLPDAGRPQEDERADGPVGVLQPARARRTALATAVDRVVLADDPLLQPLLHVHQLLDLAPPAAADRDAGPLGRRPRRCPRRPTSSLRNALPLLHLGERCVELLAAPSRARGGRRT